MELKIEVTTLFYCMECGDELNLSEIEDITRITDWLQTHKEACEADAIKQIFALTSLDVINV